MAIVVGSFPAENQGMNGNGMGDMLRELSNQLAVLGISGVAGACFRAIIAPEERWGRRVVQGLGGAMSAVFIGGLLGHGIDAVTSAGIYSYLAAGFIMGSAGEYGVKAIQDRVIGKGK